MKRFFTLILVLVFILPSLSLSELSGVQICGKWSCYFDATQLSQASQDVLDFSLLVYDLYLFDNGSAYMTNLTIDKKTQKPDFSYGALTGVWIGNQSDMSIRVGDHTYKAEITDDGYLLLYMTKALPLPFVYVDTTGKFIELR